MGIRVQNKKKFWVCTNDVINDCFSLLQVGLLKGWEDGTDDGCLVGRFVGAEVGTQFE